MSNQIILANAFSLQMLASDITDAHFESVEVSKMIELANDSRNTVISAIGHVDTAKVLSSILGVEIPTNRINIHLKKGDSVYVAQIMGGRLPEGATTLPENFNLKFIKVTLS